MVFVANDGGQQGAPLPIQAPDESKLDLARDSENSRRDDSCDPSVLPPPPAGIMPSSSGPEARGASESRWRTYFNFVAGAPARSRKVLESFVRRSIFAVDDGETSSPSVPELHVVCSSFGAHDELDEVEKRLTDGHDAATEKVVGEFSRISNAIIYTNHSLDGISHRVAAIEAHIDDRSNSLNGRIEIAQEMLREDPSSGGDVLQYLASMHSSRPEPGLGI